MMRFALITLIGTMYGQPTLPLQQMPLTTGLPIGTVSSVAADS